MGSISASLFEQQSPMSTQSMHALDALDARDGAKPGLRRVGLRGERDGHASYQDPVLSWDKSPRVHLCLYPMSWPRKSTRCVQSCGQPTQSVPATRAGTRSDALSIFEITSNWILRLMRRSRRSRTDAVR